MLSAMDRDEICTQFIDSLPFELYAFQEEALLTWFSTDTGVLISAPTGMGKTLIAEAAVYEALHAGHELYYTTPLIALTDQKFREMQDLVEQWGFDRDQVGLITGNRKVNPDAPVRIVVAEILLNHLLGHGRSAAEVDRVAAVVMDEFHSFNDYERGIVWELSLVLLPRHARVMLLSATVGNPHDFVYWLDKKHGRKLDVVITDERRVPLEYQWVDDKLLTEHLVDMVSGNDDERRTPALVFAFNRDECWELAEKLKGLPLVSKSEKQQIDDHLSAYDDVLREGVGPKLRQMLVRGVGVHHAGVLPMHKEVVEDLFTAKLIPFVCCTETLAAGINLPARSVVISSLIKGKRGEKKLIPPSSAHQMFGRAGRPQYDTNGYVFAIAHDDDVKINKWRKKYEQIDPNSKDPGLMRARKDLERKRPSRNKNAEYWTEGQFRSLIEAGPARLASRSMIPYQVLVYLLTCYESLGQVRDFLSKRFNKDETIEKFQRQLDHMIENMVGLGYLRRDEQTDRVSLDSSIHKLLTFRSVDPLFGEYLAKELTRSSFEEKILALEAVLQVPPTILRHVRIPDDIPKGPLQEHVLEPRMVQMGIVLAKQHSEEEEEPQKPRWMRDPWEEDDEERPPTFPEMLKIAFEAELPAPEPVDVQPKWIAGGTMRFDGDFFKFVRNANLIKQEGLILRHLLRLVILASEFFVLTQDPDYERLCEICTDCCQRVDKRYTEHFLAEAEGMRRVMQA